jgi:hypothetical protein
MLTSSYNLNITWKSICEYGNDYFLKLFLILIYQNDVKIFLKYKNQQYFDVIS